MPHHRGEREGRLCCHCRDGLLYRHVLFRKRFLHHGAVAFAHCGKALFEALEYFGVSHVAYNRPKSIPYAIENLGHK